MTLLLLALMTATPSPDIEAAYRDLEQARGSPLTSGRATSLAQQALPQRVFPTLQFVRATGWAEGGHRRLAPVVFAREGSTLRVVRLEQKNLDENGYQRQLVSVWLCPLDYDLKVSRLGGTDDLRAQRELDAQRPKQCEALLGRLPAVARDVALFEDLVRLVASLALEAERVTTLPARSDAALDPRLRKLVGDQEKSAEGAETSWVGEPAPFVPWKARRTGETWAGQGAATTGPDRPSLVELDATWGATFALTTRQLAFVREFIF